jgi:hypothetical protein
MHDLGNREWLILRSLDCHQKGVPAEPCLLTASEYSNAVMGLRVRGLVGADVRPVRDDYRLGTAYLVDRVWLTCEGRAYLQTAVA